MDCSLSFQSKMKKKIIFLFRTSISIEQMIEIADNERSNMEVGNLAERAGSSGGFVFSNSNSKSLSACTIPSETNKSLLVPNPNSVGATIHYQQDDGSYTKFSGVYNQALGKRYNQDQKSVQIRDRVSYKQYQSSLMTSRLMALLILEQHGLVDVDTVYKRIKEVVEQSKKQSKEQLCFDEVMARWSGTTGVIYNMEAIAAHKDGNTSHEVETLTYLPRQWSVSSFNGCDASSKCRHGYLFVPELALHLKMKTGIETMHCNLSRYYHVPDDSRNNCNFSEVHGP